MLAAEPSKAKIATRVIEVLEYFADGNPEANVMDIVRRYNRPQSSTSELLSALVKVGLLYKDSETRSYRPTPRVAALGYASQPKVIANGRLFALMDRLAQTTGQAVALFGQVGTHIQVFRWVSRSRTTGDVGCGSICDLSASAAGLLLLSALSSYRANKILWRLNAEADEGAKLDMADLKARMLRSERNGYVIGASGFVSQSNVTAVLLPELESAYPLALGVIYDEAAAVNPEALVAMLRHGATHWLSADVSGSPVFSPSMIAV